jgi:trk system potassium uptake protein TrkA
LRVLIAGGGETSKMLAEELIALGYEVVLIERDHERAEALAEELDCAVVAGDATFPDVLKKAGITETDIVVTLTNNDGDNIIIGIIAKNFEVPKVIVKIDNPQYTRLCLSLGLDKIVNPKLLTMLQVVSMVKGFDVVNLSTMIKGDARFYLVLINEKFEGKTLSEISLPKEARVVAIYRNDKFILPDYDLPLKKGDEVLFIVRENKLDELKRLFEKEKTKDK